MLHLLIFLVLLSSLLSSKGDKGDPIVGHINEANTFFKLNATQRPIGTRETRFISNIHPDKESCFFRSARTLIKDYRSSPKNGNKQANNLSKTIMITINTSKSTSQRLCKLVDFLLRQSRRLADYTIKITIFSDKYFTIPEICSLNRTTTPIPELDHTIVWEPLSGHDR
jgi:hypothetical protein